jgi:hypothetical protein
MKLDADLSAALEEAFGNMPVTQSAEFKRRFQKLCENALISNQVESEVRRVLELTIADDGEDA